MTIKKSPSLLGGAMIIAGTAIGAGMLANPTSTAGVWFIGSILALVYTWFCMTTSGLMILEANVHYPCLLYTSIITAYFSETITVGIESIFTRADKVFSSAVNFRCGSIGFELAKIP